MIKFQNVSREYAVKGGGRVYALKDVTLTIENGEMVSVAGPSGSGKTTLMNIIGCLDMPTSGEYYLDGLRVVREDAGRLAALRGRKIGFVFQSFQLIPRMSALENVETPLVFQGVPAAERRRRALYALEQVGLSDRVYHRPAELSGGQRQRTAIARAIAQQTDILLADEPTGNLDPAAAREILSLLIGLWQQGKTVIVITHDVKTAEAAGRKLELRNGRLV